MGRHRTPLQEVFPNNVVIALEGRLFSGRRSEPPPVWASGRADKDQYRRDGGKRGRAGTEQGQDEEGRLKNQGGRHRDRQPRQGSRPWRLCSRDSSSREYEDILRGEREKCGANNPERRKAKDALEEDTTPAKGAPDLTYTE